MKNLENLLKEANRKKQIHKASSLFFISLKYLFIAFILLLSADIIWHLDSQQRINGLYGFVAILVLTLGALFSKAFLTKRSLKATAREIEDSEKSFGSKLINTLDLSEQISSGKLEGKQVTFAQKAIEQYTADVPKNSFIEAINPKTLFREIKRSFIALTFICLLLIPVKHIVELELLRFLDPHGDHPAFSLTTLTISTPGDDTHKVIYGKSIVINVSVSGHQPDEVFISYYPKDNAEEVNTLPMFNKGEAGFTQQIDNIKNEIVLVAHTANKRSVSKKRNIGLILTPQILDATVTITPPAYTKRDKVSKPYNFKNVTALKGSKIEFTLESNRPLKEGTIEKVSSDKEEKVQLETLAESSVKGGFQVEENSRIRFSVIDIAGNEYHEFLKGSVTATYDRAPTVSIISPEKDSFVTEDFLLKVKVSASDDYGIKELRLHRALNGFYGPPLTFIPEDDTLQSYTEIVEVDIPTVGVVAGDIISIYADTVDNSPKGQAAITPVLHLKVVSVKQYNEYLREQAAVDEIIGKYEAIQDRMHDLGNEQKKLNEEMEKLKEKLKDPKTAKSAEKKLASLIQKQNQLNSQIKKLAEDMEKFGREDPLYDIEKSFSEKMKELAKELNESVEENKDELEKFSKALDQSKGQADQLVSALETLNEAGRKQKDKLNKQEEEYTDRVLKTILDLSLMDALVKDFNRFKYLYQYQVKLADKVKRFNVIRDLSRADELTLKKLAAEEKMISEELQQLIEDLRYHAEDAEFQFPKASKSALDLADKIEKHRLIPLADKAVNSMLIPDGPESYQLVTKLKDEMKKFFEDPNMSEMPHESNPYMKNEFDDYLSLMTGMQPGDTFQQMSQCKKLGMGQFGRGRNGRGGFSTGGDGSRDGYNSGPQIGLLGNEQLGNKEEKNKPGDGGNTRAHSEGSDNEVVAIKQDKKSSAINSTKNEGDAVSAENLINGYENLIDAYFEKITGENE
ncbi:MAG: hypothetical protein NE330_21085 [Lentisphaeraceae bacterium]|nr:hypothetical protein [Lentisphaeraceae bacterium]